MVSVLLRSNLSNKLMYRRHSVGLSYRRTKAKKKEEKRRSFYRRSFIRDVRRANEVDRRVDRTSGATRWVLVCARTRIALGRALPSGRHLAFATDRCIAIVSSFSGSFRAPSFRPSRLVR